MMSNMYSNLMKKYGWKVYDFGKIVEICGLLCTHTPLDKMGKPMGTGINPTNSILNKLNTSIIFGHNHVFTSSSKAVIGTDKRIAAYSVGTFFPTNFTPKYAENTNGGIWRGCHVIQIQNGQVLSWNAIGMHELEQKYGKVGPKVRATSPKP